MRFLPALAVVCFGSAALICAQRPVAPAEAAPQSTITVDAKLVIVPAVVRDKHGALVAGLTRDNFVLHVDGKPQTVRYFDHDADAPLTVGLLIDTSMSQRNVLDDERSASAVFLQKMLSPDRDSAFLIQFAHSVDLLQDVTTSRPKLQEGLQKVEAVRPSFGGGNNGGGDRHDRSQGGTALYDAVFLASDEVIAPTKGRRSLILLTDGDDRGSLTTLAKSIESAQRADTIVYAIYYKDEHEGGFGHGYPGGGGGGGHHGGGGFPFAEGGQMGGGHGGYGQQVDGKKVLEQMCLATGGRVFEVSKKETVEKIYEEIGQELRSQYRLGFTPTAEGAAAGYHQIDLTLAGPAASGKNKIQARDGYYRR
jgi:VWFA-related protein